MVSNSKLYSQQGFQIGIPGLHFYIIIIIIIAIITFYFFNELFM